MLSTLLRREGLATEEELTRITADVDREVNDAADRALAAAKPHPDTAARYLYSPTINPTSDAFATEPAPNGKADTMVAAINRTLKDEMARNPRIVVFGEESRTPAARKRSDRCPARAACSR